MLTDNFGKILASMLSNTAGVGAYVYLQSYTGDIQFPSQVGNWNTGAHVSGRTGFFGGGNAPQSNITYCALGSGSTPVQRSDFYLETPVIGLSSIYVSGAGYGSGIVTLTGTMAAFGAPATIREGAILKSGTNDHNNLSIHTILRYNYTPILFGIGEQAVVETVLNL
jgi:hypothetical protein